MALLGLIMLRQVCGCEFLLAIEGIDTGWMDEVGVLMQQAPTRPCRCSLVTTV